MPAPFHASHHPSCPCPLQGFAAGGAVHAAALAAAQRLLADLKAHGILESLLHSSLPGAGHGDARTTAPAQQHIGLELGGRSGPARGQATPQGSEAHVATAAGCKRSGFAATTAGRGAGWSLVLTGHGQGAGAAVLLGMRLLPQHPGACTHVCLPGALHRPAVIAGCTWPGRACCVCVHVCISSWPAHTTCL